MWFEWPRCSGGAFCGLIELHIIRAFEELPSVQIINRLEDVNLSSVQDAVNTGVQIIKYSKRKTHANDKYRI